ncbi:MAG: efflux RND transporter permease subunit, partial [Phycisphaeraceae bacterium]
MAEDHNSLLDRLIRFCLEQKLVVVVTVLLLIGWGVAVAPFDWEMGGLRAEVDSVAVDAIPNLGENQQIVFTEWPGRSPQDIEDQVTYPLTVTLMGVPGVKEVRSRSMFGFSSIFVIFHDDVEFYWSRARLIEKLNALPSGLLPGEVQPALGPDATGMGQIFWYTLEGRSPDGEPTGGWDLHELRSVQDWFVRYGLTGAEGVSEVASIGGHVREYHVDVDPDAMRSHGVTMGQIAQAVGNSNVEVGARTTEINQVEYVIRGLGYVRGLGDIEKAVVRAAEGGVPIKVSDVANVTLGPAERRGALTMAGAEAVGGVVVVREGYNPLSAIQNVKAKIAEIEGGLPAKVLIDWTQTTREEVENFAALWGIEDFQGEAGVAWLRSNDRALWPEWASISQLAIVPFYDRTELIYETLGTLNDALVQQILVTMIVVIVLVVHLRASLVISGMLPMAVLICFIGMKLAGVEANVVALAGIAIAIGTIVDMGLIVSENVLRHLAEADDEEDRLEVVYRATREVGGAVLTAVGTTVVSFLPVFALTGAAGKMFTPLAFTKTFVLIAAAGLAITVVPAAAHVLIAGRVSNRAARQAVWVVLALAGLIIAAVGAMRGWTMVWPAGLGLMAIACYHIATGLLGERRGEAARKVGGWLANIVAAALVVWVLA